MIPDSYFGVSEYDRHKNGMESEANFAITINNILKHKNIYRENSVDCEVNMNIGMKGESFLLFQLFFRFPD